MDMARGRADEVDSLCKELGRSSNARITVVLPSGEVLGDSHEIPRDMDNHGGRPEVLEALGGKVGRSRRYSSTEQEDRIYVAVPLMRGNSPIALVRASLPVAALTHTLGIVRGRIVVAALIGILLHAVITLAISRRISSPLEEIQAGAERFAAGQLGHEYLVVRQQPDPRRRLGNSPV